MFSCPSINGNGQFFGLFFRKWCFFTSQNLFADIFFDQFLVWRVWVFVIFFKFIFPVISVSLLFLILVLVSPFCNGRYKVYKFLLNVSIFSICTHYLLVKIFKSYIPKILWSYNLNIADQMEISAKTFGAHKLHFRHRICQTCSLFIYLFILFVYLFIYFWKTFSATLINGSIERKKSWLTQCKSTKRTRV